MCDLKSVKLITTIKGALLELTYIFAAIMLALYVDEWNEERQRNERIELFVASVQNELKLNHASLLAAHKHQSESINIIDNFPKQGEELTESEAVEIYRKLYRRSVYRPAELMDTAWQVLTGSQLLNYMDHSQVLGYTKFFMKQNRLADTQRQFTTMMANTTFDDIETVAFIRGLRDRLNDIWWHEKMVLKEFDTLNNELKFLAEKTIAD